MQQPNPAFNAIVEMNGISERATEGISAGDVDIHYETLELLRRHGSSSLQCIAGRGKRNHQDVL